VEELEEYQQGFLPCQTSNQACANELHHLGQTITPFEKVERWGRYFSLGMK
jgi:hypothetical protein